MRKTASLPTMTVKRVTLPSEIYKRIKDMILDGGLVPGELVTIQGLAEAFGVSAMPVREALQRLTGERALTVISGRSVGVPELDRERFEDMSRVRVRLESLAAEWATARIGPEQLNRLDQLIETMDHAIAVADTRAFVRANHEFHFTIYATAGSELLLTIIEGLWLQVSPYFHLLYGSGNYVAANQEHRHIVVALRQRKAAIASLHLRQDIETATKVLVALLGQNNLSARTIATKK
jgi:DNA-binding GntR family transcriptional regulator